MVPIPAGNKVPKPALFLFETDARKGRLMSRAYRLYLHNEERRLIAPGIIIDAVSDDEAIRKADKYIDGIGGDLLDDLRLVKQFEPKK
jgi:hypothetical protein